MLSRLIHKITLERRILDIGPMSISFFIAWYDLRVGLSYDQKKRVLYVCPLPCFVFKYTHREISDVCPECHMSTLTSTTTTIYSCGHCQSKFKKGQLNHEP